MVEAPEGFNGLLTRLESGDETTWKEIARRVNLTTGIVREEVRKELLPYLQRCIERNLPGYRSGVVHALHAQSREYYTGRVEEAEAALRAIQSGEPVIYKGLEI